MDRPSISNREWQKVAPIAVILGARLRADGTASAALLRRVHFGCHLHQRGEVQRLLMTGGATSSRQAEADCMAHHARSLGLPDHDLIIESQARTTRENALYACTLLLQAQSPISKDPNTSANPQLIVVVTDLYHLPRAWLTFRIIGRHTGFRFRFLPCPPSPGSVLRAGYWRSVLREIPAFAVDLFRCWLVVPPRAFPATPEAPR